MAHYKHSAESTRSAMTPTNWLPIGAKIGRLANAWAERTDLVAFVGENAGQGVAPALFNPALAEVEVNVKIAFGPNAQPEHINDLLNRDTQLEWPKASGAILHEAAHARYSRWNAEAAHSELSRLEFDALMLLEESRIEAQCVQLMPHNRVFLRSCALQIVLADLNSDSRSLSDSWEAARLAALTLARVDAGVLDKKDVAAASDLISIVLSEETLAKLQAVWVEFQAHHEHFNATPLYDLARRWVEIVKESAEERGEPSPEQQAGGEGGDGIMQASAFAKEIVEALSQDADIVEIVVQGEIADLIQDSEWEEEVKRRKSAASVRSDNRRAAESVFGDGEEADDANADVEVDEEQAQKSTAEVSTRNTNSTLIESRMPLPSERAAAVKIAQLLERAKYRERSETEIHSILPPGRLRTRAVVQGAAMKQAGVISTSEPWRRTARKHTDDPTLTVGVMVDISGSMRAAMEPMATTAWVMSEAVRRVQGRTAMVYYGQDVFPTLKPGQHLPKVNVFSANDSTEKFDKAFRALDGALDLLNGSGARLLVVVSDGCYTGDERKNANRWVNMCLNNGVGVLWLPFDSGYHVNAVTDDKRVQVVKDLRDPAAAAMTIGQAAAQALTRVQSAA